MQNGWHEFIPREFEMVILGFLIDLSFNDEKHTRFEGLKVMPTLKFIQQRLTKEICVFKLTVYVLGNDKSDNSGFF